MRILAVDDDEIALDLLRVSLEGTGLGRVTAATSAMMALDEITKASKPFECFLLDIVMPDMDGIALCSAIRAMPEYRMTPIIMVSALPELHNLELAFAAGAHDYVRKPFDGLELGTRINIAAIMNGRLKQALEEQRQLTRLVEQSGSIVGIRSAVHAEGVVDYLALENYLLRLPAGCFAMSLFGAELTNQLDLKRRLSTTEYQDLLKPVAEAISWSLPKARFVVSYVEHGQFVGIVMRRGGLSLSQIQNLLNERLAEIGSTNEIVAKFDPDVKVFEVSRLRVLSGHQALTAIETFIDTREKASPQTA